MLLDDKPFDLFKGEIKKGVKPSPEMEAAADQALAEILGTVQKTKPSIAALRAKLSKAFKISEHYPELHDQADHGNWAHGGGALPGKRAEMFKAETAIRLNKIETAIVYSSDGKEIYRQTGDERSVKFAPEMIAKFKDGVFTHNHPSGFGMSDDDMRFAANADLREMRVVSENKFGYVTAVLKRPEHGWPPVVHDDYRTSVNNAAVDFSRKVRDIFTNRITDGKLSIEQANQAHWYAVTALVAKKINAEFHVIRTRKKNTL